MKNASPLPHFQITQVSGTDANPSLHLQSSESHDHIRSALSAVKHHTYLLFRIYENSVQDENYRGSLFVRIDGTATVLDLQMMYNHALRTFMICTGDISFSQDVQVQQVINRFLSEREQGILQTSSVMASIQELLSRQNSSVLAVHDTDVLFYQSE